MSPISVYLAYAPADLDLLRRLRTQLAAVERIGVVDAWHDEEVEIGSDREQAMLQALHDSPIIVLLISADFLASEFAFEKELKIALQLQRENKAQVLPVILRECTWKYTALAKMEVLPPGGIPVTNDHWQTVDEAFLKVVDAVMAACEKHQNPTKGSTTTTPIRLSDTNTASTPIATFSPKENTENGNRSLTDPRNQKTYDLVAINDQLWMKQDLTFKTAEGHWEIQGDHYYDQKAARQACPPGWRLPTKAEWKALTPEQLASLALQANGLVDRGHGRDQGRKAYYWSGENSFGGEAWCWEQRPGKEARVESRYLHWAMSCRCVKINSAAVE